MPGGQAPGLSVCTRDCKKIISYESLYEAFKDLQSRFQSLPWLPTILFGNSYRQEVLICSLHYARSAVLGDALSIRTTPAPSTVYYSNGGMEHGTCLVKSTITLTLVPNNQWTPRVGTVWGVGQRGSIYFNVQVPGGRTGHFVYITRGRKCSCDMSRG